MEPGAMLKALKNSLAYLPELLARRDKWDGLLIDYDLPKVEGIYTDLEGGNRLSLHIHTIHLCEEGQSPLHLDPSPSAIFIVSGFCQVDFGFSKDLTPPEALTRIYLRPGSYYELTDPNCWHSARPVNNFSASVMINGQKWDREMPKLPQYTQKPLDPKRKENFILVFENAIKRMGEMKINL